MPYNGQGPAMKVPLGTQYDRLAFFHTLLLQVCPLPSELDAGLHSLCTRVHGEDHPIPEQLGDLARKATKYGVVEGTRG